MMQVVHALPGSIAAAGQAGCRLSTLRSGFLRLYQPVDLRKIIRKCERMIKNWSKTCKLGLK
jgi:hypothetical protein